MHTADGPKMLEYNCRFGDPEAQAVLPLVQGDFAEYLLSAAEGEIDKSKIAFDDSWSICLVLASAGYPAVRVRATSSQDSAMSTAHGSTTPGRNSMGRGSSKPTAVE